MSQFRFGARSERNLKGVHSDLVKVARLALVLSPIDFAITEGLRSKERQLDLYHAGKSQTKAGRHVTGHAIDVAAWIDGAVDWAWERYERLNEAFQAAANDLGVAIVWGGSWQTLKDGVHFELDREVYP